MKRFVFVILFLLLGCSSASEETAVIDGEPADLVLPVGFSAEILPYQFDRPTQFLIDNNSLWVAQLNGGENAEQGQVLRVDLVSGERAVVLEKLDKPTGIALLEDALWVATRDAILRYDFDSGTTQVVLENLPNNGRSNGTLTVTPDNLIVYETSGNKRQADSGKLWTLDPVTLESAEIASGIKGAYAHAIDNEGRIFFTDMGDGSIGGEPLIDEINLLVEGGNYGWPTCYGRDLQGPDCSGALPAVTTFAAHSSPTSVISSPFNADELLVALWLTGEVVSLPLTFDGDGATGDATTFIDSFDNPQHMLVLGDALLVSDYRRGVIYRVWQE